MPPPPPKMNNNNNNKKSSRSIMEVEVDLVLATLVLVLAVGDEVPCNSSNNSSKSMSMMSMTTEKKKIPSREKIVDRVSRMKAMGRFDGILGWGVELEIIGGLFYFFFLFLDGWMDGLVGFLVPIQVSF